MTRTPFEDRVTQLLHEVADSTRAPSREQFAELMGRSANDSVAVVVDDAAANGRGVSRRALLVAGGVTAAAIGVGWMFNRRQSQPSTAPQSSGVASSVAVPTTPVAAHVALAGDGFLTPIESVLANRDVTVESHLIVSSGLARPTFFDWENALGDLLPTLPAGAVLVFSAGSNDTQALVSADGGPAVEFGSADWSSEYRGRVARVADLVSQAGHPLVWIGVAQARDPNFTARLEAVRASTMQALASRNDATYVDSWLLLAGPDGKFISTMVSNGSTVAVRAVDGYGLTPGGAELLAQSIPTS